MHLLKAFVSGNECTGEYDELAKHAIQTGVGSEHSSKLQLSAEVEVLEPTPATIIMDSLWFLVVKCKLRQSLKK